MPLSAIKQKLDSASDLSTLAFEVGLLTDAPMKVASKETRQKLHLIEDVPDILGVDIAFLRQLADNDLIRIVRSPQNRELIDGRDFEIIRYCSELSRFHIEPRNLRQYVIAANRESALFEQVLIGMLGTDDSDDDREAKLDRAFKTLHDLTDGVRTALLRNRVFESLNAVVEDADVDAIDDEITRAGAGGPGARSRIVRLLHLILRHLSARRERTCSPAHSRPTLGRRVESAHHGKLRLRVLHHRHSRLSRAGRRFKDITPLFADAEAMRRTVMTSPIISAMRASPRSSAPRRAAS